MLRRSLLFAVILILSSFYVSAYGFDIEVEPIKTTIFVNEGAEYKVTVRNNLEYENRYRIILPDFSLWSVQTSPQSHRLSGILVQPNSEVSTILKVYPTEKVWPGRYQIKLVIESEKTDEEVRKILNLNLVSGEYHQAEFKPDVLVTVDIPNDGKLDPRQKQVIKISLKNKNLLNIGDLSLMLKSELVDGQKSGIALEPLQRKIEEFTVVLDPFHPPMNDSLITTVSVQNKTFTVVKEYQVIGYTEPFIEEVKTDKGLLRTKQVITLTNPSNTESKEVYRIKTNIFERLFVFSKPKAVVIKEEELYLGWKLNMPAQGSVTINVTTNYIPLLLIIILVTVGVLSYYGFRSPLIVLKTVREIKKKHDGISELNLMLTVKNRNKKPISNIKVVDKIPNIIQIEREFKIGTIQPSKVTKHEGRGTIIAWDIDSLEENEERIITYRIKSKLSIVGRFALPPASIKFKTTRGRAIVVHSNVLSLK
ncbi:hypothetical protein CMO89_03925 [Candidatus Woesearchaeota archaeon]|nr:hypothetical protein [Candidatus Woesearchaeota archaeon]